MVQEDKKEYKEIELRSEEVQEVMSHVPVWILRWGITVLFCIVIILLIGSYLFKYPDVVEAEITVSTQNPPAYVVARVAGRLEELCAENGAVVRKEAVLGMIENSAKAEDLFLLTPMAARSGSCPEYGRTAFRRAIFATRRSTACLCFVYFCSERLCEFRETGLLPQETGEQSETFGESEDVLPTGRETIPVGRTRADVDKTYLWT